MGLLARYRKRQAERAEARRAYQEAATFTYLAGTGNLDPYGDVHSSDGDSNFQGDA
jgi:hypothetical protein